MIRLTAIGNLGKDAVVRTSGTDSAIGFSVAVNKKYTKNGVKMEETTWLNATYWRTGDQTANVAQYLKAGTLVYLEGEVNARSYVTKEGEARAELEVRVSKLDLLGSKPEVAAAAPAIKNDRKPGAMPQSEFGSEIERELKQFDHEQAVMKATLDKNGSYIERELQEFDKQQKGTRPAARMK